MGAHGTRVRCVPVAGGRHEPGLPLLPAARQRRLALLLGVARGVRGSRRAVSVVRGVLWHQVNQPRERAVTMARVETARRFELSEGCRQVA